MPTYLFKCRECEHVTATILKYEERLTSLVLCEECTGPTDYGIYEAPGITVASFVDGTKRPGFQDMKEAIKLERKMLNLPPEKRAEVKKEIRKLKEVKK